ncbi:hypothetical protein KKA95_01290 [Patescibacteria group bacterium]|nr:hypothetical protein [Patescibacteria group bacterium]
MPSKVEVEPKQLGSKKVGLLYPVEVGNLSNPDYIAVDGRHYRKMPSSASFREPDKNAEADLISLTGIRDSLRIALRERERLEKARRQAIINVHVNGSEEEIPSATPAKEHLCFTYNEGESEIEFLDPEVALPILETAVKSRRTEMENRMSYDLEGSDEDLDALIEGLLDSGAYDSSNFRNN